MKTVRGDDYCGDVQIYRFVGWWCCFFGEAGVEWDVVDLQIRGDCLLWVRFRDGVEGIVQFMPSAFRGVFAGLRDPVQFRLASVVDGVVTWPIGLDIAPDAMHAEITRNGRWVVS